MAHNAKDTHNWSKSNPKQLHGTQAFQSRVKIGSETHNVHAYAHVHTMHGHIILSTLAWTWAVGTSYIVGWKMGPGLITRRSWTWGGGAVSLWPTQLAYFHHL